MLIQRFNMLSLTSILEPVRIANYLAPHPLYSVEFRSFDGRVVTSSNDLGVQCDPVPEKLGRKDVVLVFGSWGSEHYQNPKALSWLRLQARLGARICGVEIGAFLLARSGLLSQKEATTHWSYLPGFLEQFPDIKAVEQIFTVAGNLMTCSGGTGGIDLMLHLIGQQHGASLVGEISDLMMHHPVRPAETPQRTMYGRGTETFSPAVRAAVDLIESHISDPLSVPEVSRRVGLSQRHLVRQFGKEMGCSIVQFGRLMRLHRARTLLMSTELGVHEISVASGFNSLSHFNYAFKKYFDKRPNQYRRLVSDQEADVELPETLAPFFDSVKVGRGSLTST